MSWAGRRAADRIRLGAAACVLGIALVATAVLAPAGQAGGVGILDNSGRDVAIQPDGKIVVAGYTSDGDGGSDFAVARYRSDGSLDDSFSGDGRRTTTFGADFDVGLAVAVQADGKLVVAGSSDQIGTGRDFAIARYRSDGSLDDSFSGDGKRTTTFGTDFDAGQGIAIQGNGRIVVVGISDADPGAGTAYDLAIARYMPNGSLDDSFSNDGKRTTTFGLGSDSGYAVAIQPDQKIIVAGYSDQSGSGADFAVARHMPSGSLDDSFSENGKVTTTFGPMNDQVQAIAVQANGRIVAAGYVNKNSTDYDFALARYRAGGTLDDSFSADGKRTTTFGPGSDTAADVAIQSTQRIVVVGDSDQDPGSGFNFDFAIARYRAAGALDGSFSEDGKRTTTFGPGGDTAGGVALQGNGRIVVAGYGDVDPSLATDNDFALARHLLGGGLDPSFSGNGKQTTSF